MTRSFRSVLLATAGLLVAATSCNVERPVAPNRVRAVNVDAANVTVPPIVISQVYGGGGNQNSVLKNDFVELFNPGTAAVDVSGWKVQYTSSGGTTWTNTTTLPAGQTIPAGGYYLVQEAAGGGGTQNLPTPDATGTIAMAAGSGKVFLTQAGVILSSVACPTNAGIVDKVSYGSASDCGFGTTGSAIGNNITAAIRNNNGCKYTEVLSADFAYGTPNPRNSATPTNICGSGVIPLTATGAANPSSLSEGNATLLTATITSSAPGTTISVAADLSSIGGLAVAPMFDNGTSGDVTAGDKVFSLATTVAVGTTTGQKTLPVSLSDNEGRTGTTSIGLTVIAPPAPPADLVISQVYGGGGNNGATLTNDFIEIFNRSGDPVNLAGWSVQYSSAEGASWQVTPLTGTIQPHKYVLIQEDAGSGGTTPLPTPDVTGTIGMGGTAGKVALASQTAALTGPCPSGASVVDRVGYGSNSTADGCGAVWGGRTANVSATAAAFRFNDGCINTNSGASDFYVSTPMPRNSAAPAHTCALSAASIVINEILTEPVNADGGSSWGEWFEVKNTGAAPVDLQGWTITSANQPRHVISASVVVPPGGYRVLGRGSDPALNGGITIDYNYFVGGGTNTIFLDNSDVLVLNDAAGALVDMTRWSGGTFVPGYTRGVRNATADNFDVAGPNWGWSTTTFGDGDFGTPGADNGTLTDTKPIVPTITFSGRVPTDPALPVGFEAQIFASEGDGSGGFIPTTFTWSSLTPSIASIDANGVIRALSAGSASFRATATDGNTATYTLPMAVAAASSTAQYGNNTEFGDPVDGDPGNDFIIRRAFYTTSYNQAKGTPNWVSYDLDGSHIGTNDRCNCFTPDAELPASFPHISTADYVGAGAFAGYGIDRGHMTRSFDRTSGPLDNAYTFLLSNVIPQAADLNQGPWAVMETFLGDLARFSNKEVYVITGPAGNKGTVKNEGKLVIPTHVWKVAVVMPRDKGLADVHNYTDIEVYAVIMPNDPGVRNVDWHTYLTTVDAVEALSGYDLLALLPDNIEAAVESNTKPPIGTLDGPYSSSEGSPVTLSAAGSFDPNGTVVSYAWNFGDGATGSGVSTSHTYAQDGSYTVTLTLTDNDGLTDVLTTTATVSNVAPTVGAFAGATLPAGFTYTASGTFSDPGADVCTATVDYGDGTGVHSLALSGGGFSLSHVYTAAGTYTVTVRVTDDHVTTTQVATVTVITTQAALANIAATIDAMVAGGALSAGNGNSLTSKLEAAIKSLDKGNATPARNQLNAMLNEISALLNAGRLSPSDAAALRAAVQAILNTI